MGQIGDFMIPCWTIPQKPGRLIVLKDDRHHGTGSWPRSVKNGQEVGFNAVAFHSISKKEKLGFTKNQAMISKDALERLQETRLIDIST